jgi:hypothetical protein
MGNSNEVFGETIGLEFAKSSRDVQRVAKNQEFDLVEGSAPSETEKEIVHGVRAGFVGAPATP